MQEGDTVNQAAELPEDTRAIIAAQTFTLGLAQLANWVATHEEVPSYVRGQLLELNASGQEAVTGLLRVLYQSQSAAASPAMSTAAPSPIDAWLARGRERLQTMIAKGVANGRGRAGAGEDDRQGGSRAGE